MIALGTDSVDSLSVTNTSVTLGAAPVTLDGSVEKLAVKGLGGDDVVTFDLGTQVTAAGPMILVDGNAGNDTISAGNANMTWTLTSKISGTVATTKRTWLW